MIPVLETDSLPLLVRQEYLDQYLLLENNPDEVKPYAPQALAPSNKVRNRYGDIFPFQENIFRFKDPSLYFNASSVLQGRAISCQGPLDIEHSHFWRMVWEENSAVIVMLTKLEERTRIKCDQYWPSRGSAQYGHITVATREVTELAHYTVRTFHLQRVSFKLSYLS